MIYAILMAAGIMEALFAGLLIMEFFDLEAEKEAEYVEGYEDGYNNAIVIYQQLQAECSNDSDELYYDALCDEANYWFGMDGDV